MRRDLKGEARLQITRSGITDLIRPLMQKLPWELAAFHALTT